MNRLETLVLTFGLWTAAPLRPQFQPMATGCWPDNGGFDAHPGTMANCTLTYYTCVAPSGSIIGYILAAPGITWYPDDMGGLTDICNGDGSAMTSANYVTIDQTGGQIPPANFAPQCLLNGLANCNDLASPSQASQSANTQYVQCSNVIFNDCASGNASACVWNSSSTPSCFLPSGVQVEGLPNAVVSGFQNWATGKTALSTALGGDWSDPVGGAGSFGQGADAVAGAISIIQAASQ
jgi:hypothetical protein